MVFKDEVPCEVTAGKGGDGAATFRREKYVPFGGPDGGDGGVGGSVILKVNPHLRTLSYIHNNQKFRAEDGVKGSGSNSYGRKGQDFILEVPQGTEVYDAETRQLICDLVEPDSEFLIAQGGKGGLGNWHFKSSTNQSPFYAKKGKPGEHKKLLLELKMIAHVGLVGFPNAGKSTLVSRITNARPKIGNYPFTTLQPNIGVMTIDDAFTSILIADIPGLIEGAHEGKGLGIEFLKHIERTRVILYLLDCTDEPKGKLKILQNELKSYSKKLYQHECLVGLNKIDMLTSEDEKKSLKKEFKKYGADLHFFSGLTGEGLPEFRTAIYKKYLEAEKNLKAQEEQEKKNGPADLRNKEMPEHPKGGNVL